MESGRSFPIWSSESLDSGCSLVCLIIPCTTLRSFTFAVPARSKIYCSPLFRVSRAELSSRLFRRKKSFARGLVTVTRAPLCHGLHAEWGSLHIMQVTTPASTRGGFLVFVTDISTSQLDTAKLHGLVTHSVSVAHPGY